MLVEFLFILFKRGCRFLEEIKLLLFLQLAIESLSLLLLLSDLIVELFLLKRLLVHALAFVFLFAALKTCSQLFGLL